MTVTLLCSRWRVALGHMARFFFFLRFGNKFVLSVAEDILCNAPAVAAAVAAEKVGVSFDSPLRLTPSMPLIGWLFVAHFIGNVFWPPPNLLCLGGVDYLAVFSLRLVVALARDTSCFQHQVC